MRAHRALCEKSAIFHCLYLVFGVYDGHGHLPWGSAGEERSVGCQPSLLPGSHCPTFSRDSSSLQTPKMGSHTLDW